MESPGTKLESEVKLEQPIFIVNPEYTIVLNLLETLKSNLEIGPGFKPAAVNSEANSKYCTLPSP